MPRCDSFVILDSNVVLMRCDALTDFDLREREGGRDEVINRREVPEPPQEVEAHSD